MIYLIILSSFAFIFYGVLVLSTDHMGNEFERYELSKFRILTGVLELLGGVGSLVGILYSPILLLSSFGLSMLMFLGISVRIRVQDPWLQTLPALFLMLINGYIFYKVLMIEIL